MNDFFRRILYLPIQGTRLATEIDGFHYFVITITMLGATAVFGAALWFTFRYRRHSDLEITPRIRGGWIFESAVIGGLLTLFVSIWVFGFHQYMHMQTPPADAMDVYVVAKKWMWKFSYPNGFRSQGVLVVPEGRNVRLILTSRDVIHSFYVPAFRMKQDVLPGRYTTFWFRADKAGIYRVYCAEFCGEAHSEMWADVVALRADEFEAWESGGAPPQLLSEALSDFDRAIGLGGGVAVLDFPRTEGLDRRTMAERGRDVAARKGCLSCHTLDGQPHLGPTWRGLWGSWRPIAGGNRTLADDAYLTRSMMDPGVEVVEGYPNLMPTYQGQLEPEDVGSLIELIKSLRDPLPPPKDVKLPTLPELQVDLVMGPVQGTPAGVPDPGEREPTGGLAPALPKSIPPTNLDEGEEPSRRRRREAGGGERALETDRAHPSHGPMSEPEKKPTIERGHRDIDPGEREGGRP